MPRTNPPHPSRRPTLRVHGAGLGTAASEFIPVPFLDEWMINRQRKAMVKALLRRRGITHGDGVPGILASGAPSLAARLASFSKGLMLKPFRKLFRGLFFWLAAKRAARTALVTYLLARFVEHPDLAGGGPHRHIGPERAKELSEIFRSVSKGIDLRAAGGAFRQLIRIFGKSKGESGQEISNAIEESAPGFPAGFDAMVDDRLAPGRDGMHF